MRSFVQRFNGFEAEHLHWQKNKWKTIRDILSHFDSFHYSWVCHLETNFFAFSQRWCEAKWCLYCPVTNLINAIIKYKSSIVLKVFSCQYNSRSLICERRDFTKLVTLLSLLDKIGGSESLLLNFFQHSTVNKCFIWNIAKSGLRAST